MEQLNEIIAQIDDFVWGPVMLVLLVGTGIFLTFRTRFLTWRNLGYALKSTLSKEARTKSRGEGDVSPFSALTTHSQLLLEQVILLVLQLLWYLVVRELLYGCGFRQRLA